MIKQMASHIDVCSVEELREKNYKFRNHESEKDPL